MLNHRLVFSTTIIISDISKPKLAKFRNNAILVKSDIFDTCLTITSIIHNGPKIRCGFVNQDVGLSFNTDIMLLFFCPKYCIDPLDNSIFSNI